MHINNRRRTQTEGAVVHVDNAIKDISNEIIVTKKFNANAHHKRVHSVPVSFDDLYLGLNEFREPMSHEYCELDTNKENFRTIPEELNIAERIRRERWNTVEMYCLEYPELARKPIQVAIYGEQIRCLPLHFACRMNPPVSVIDALITAFPEALVIRDTFGRTPIHFACSFNASFEVVKTLLEACPEAAKLQDQDGNLPLHLACCFSTSEVSEILLQVYPRASLIANAKKKLPVHLLCSKPDVNASSLSSLITIHPEVVFIADRQGTLPIHLAITHRAPLSVVEFLLSSHPQSVFVRNNKGKTPLDLAKLIYRSPDSHPILQTVQNAYDTNGTPMSRAVNSLVSQYNAVAAKRTKENNNLIRLKFVTVYPQHPDVGSEM